MLVHVYTACSQSLPTVTGPFLITCGPDTPSSTAANQEKSTLYIYTKPDHKLGVTKDNSEAAMFCIVPMEGSHPHEFKIMSTSDLMTPLPPLAPKERLKCEEKAKRTISPYSLEAKCNIRGKQRRDLKMQRSVKSHNARMALQKSVVDDNCKVPVDITRWLQGEESCFIRCARRVRCKDGYLCVKQPLQGRLGNRKRSENYEVKVVPSIKKNDDDKNSFMLFRLLPQGFSPGLADQYIRIDGDSSLSHAQGGKIMLF